MGCNTEKDALAKRVDVAKAIVNVSSWGFLVWNYVNVPVVRTANPTTSEPMGSCTNKFSTFLFIINWYHTDYPKG